MNSLLVPPILLLFYLSVGLSQRLADCPLSWQRYKNKCYKFEIYPTLHYEEAVRKCQGYGAALVSVNDQQEHDFISRHLLQIETQHNADWWTSGVYMNGRLKWLGDGTFSSDQQWLTPADQFTLPIHVVYQYSAIPNKRFGWTKLNGNTLCKYICEIPVSEIQRIVQSQRDFTFGTHITDLRMAPRGPAFLEQPVSIVFTARSFVSYIECLADGNPQPTYTWYRARGNNVMQEISASRDSRYTLNNGRLTISRPNETLDTGVYQCKAENQFGAIMSSFARISWGSLAQFSNVPPGTNRVPLYQGTFLNCRPPSYKPAVTFQWRKDGNFLMSELNPYFFLSAGGNLYFSEVQQSDQGDYHCMVSLSAGPGQKLATDQPTSRTSPNIHLTVTGETAANYAPQIHNDFPAVFPRQPLRGQTIRFECLAYGRLPLKYSWRRSEKSVPARAKYMDLNRVMIIEDVQVDDEGTYSCYVERIDGQSDLKPYTLTIGAAPYFVSPLPNIHADINSDLTWRCEAIGKPRPTYTWYRNSQPLTSVPGKLEIVSNILKIKTLAVTDEGMYQCGAKNDYGTTYSNAQLRVLSFKPSFFKNPLPTSMLAGIGGNITIPCAPEAAPTPEIVWKKDNTGIGMSDRRQMLINGYLKITGVSGGDQGYYTCTASNDNGQAFSTTLVTVSQGITLTSRPAPTRVSVNETAFLRCEASYDSSLYDLIYQWKFNGKTIEFGEGFGLVYQKGEREGTKGLYINYADFYHDGEYECIAQTTTQHQSAKAVLTVLGPPGEPAKVYCEKNTATPHSIQVTWTVAPDHGATVESYIIETSTSLDQTWRVQVKEVRESQTIYHPVFTDRRTFVVEGLTPFSSYRFRVRARNRFPEPGTPSLPSEYYTLPKAKPIKPPQNVGGGQGSVGVLTMKWNPLPQKDWCGEKIGYKVHWRRKGTQESWQTEILNDPAANQHVESLGVEFYYLEYEVKVGVFNEVGDGPNSTVAIVYSAEGMPTYVPTNVNGYEYNGTAIIVTWDPVPNTREVVKGVLVGFEINFEDNENPNYKSGTTYVYGSNLTQGMVVGLYPNSDYWITVQIFNWAGESNPSETQRVSTYLSAPFLYPEYVNVSSHGSDSVYVAWRGISTGLQEEPILGYKLRYWPQGDSIRNAKDVVTEKITNGVIYGIQKGVVYKLRVLGYSNGGDGKKSPTVYFTLGGRVQIDPATSEIMAGSHRVSSSIFVLISLYILSFFIC